VLAPAGHGFGVNGLVSGKSQAGKAPSPIGGLPVDRALGQTFTVVSVLALSGRAILFLRTLWEFRKPAAQCSGPAMLSSESGAVLWRVVQRLYRM